MICAPVGAYDDERSPGERPGDSPSSGVAHIHIYPLFTISKEGDESAKNVDIINYF
nr:MAG TPA: hypothetical protein [Caudoviricetes sp.]